MAKKLTIVEDIEKQLDIVRLHEWVQGTPEKFNQACLVVRSDAKEIVTDPDKAANVLNGYEDFSWYELRDDGSFIVFRPAPDHNLSRGAERVVAKARTQLGYLCPFEEVNGKADQDANVDWNDGYAIREQVIEVLTLALKLARKQYGRKGN